jgi:DnaJ-class molecular chaperone
MPRRKDSGSSSWRDVCPACDGSGKLRTEHKKEHITDEPTNCDFCGGSGLIPVILKPRKRI